MRFSYAIAMAFLLIYTRVNLYRSACRHFTHDRPTKEYFISCYNAERQKLYHITDLITAISGRRRPFPSGISTLPQLHEDAYAFYTYFSPHFMKISPLYSRGCDISAFIISEFKYNKARMISSVSPINEEHIPYYFFAFTSSLLPLRLVTGAGSKWAVSLPCSTFEL